MKTNKITAIAAMLLIAGSTTVHAQQKSPKSSLHHASHTSASKISGTHKPGEVKTAGLLNLLTGRGYGSYNKGYSRSVRPYGVGIGSRPYGANYGRGYSAPIRTRSVFPSRSYRSNGYRAGCSGGYGSNYGYGSQPGFSGPRRGYYGR